MPGAAPHSPCFPLRSGYAFLRLRRLRVNPDAYSRMEHQFNEVGQLSSARM